MTYLEKPWRVKWARGPGEDWASETAARGVAASLATRFEVTLWHLEDGEWKLAEDFSGNAQEGSPS